ncbi:MAG: flagellar filament capping protein FliD [Campylobacterales bacterium]|nr:flagellar filament capping protein FliD [Campylobacterales bacterium]
MAGNISSLGIGSGVLTADVLDQLRAADEATQIAPIAADIELNQQKQDAYSLLTSLMTSFKASASALSYDTIFDNKSVNVSGEATVSIDAGMDVDSFTLETINLAKKDVTKLGAMTDRDETLVASSSGILTIGSGEESFEVSYNSTMTLQDLAQAITDAGGDTFSASILQTGTDSFNLVVSSKQTGANQALTITDTSGNLDAALFNAYDEATNPYGYEKVQEATDATFKYNGILATRGTNSFNDFVNGVNITLNEEGDFSNVNISLDKTPIVDEMQLLVDSYNELVSNLNDMTDYKVETGVEGVFNNDSFIKSLSRELSSMMTQIFNGDSLINYGIELNETGTMSFSASTLEAKIDADPEAVQAFFTGSTDTNGEFSPGIFTNINEQLVGYTGPNQLFSSFAEALDTESKKFAESLENATASLDARYAAMAARFAAYDSLISQINAQFSSIQMMIDAESN